MATMLALVAAIFISLFLLVPLIEKYVPRASPEQQQRISRWILPLVAVGIVVALLQHLLNG